MKVFLPSNNMMGLTSVEMRDPKIGDLRKIPNYSFSSIIKKTEYVRDLVGDDVLKITPQDRDYLFLLAVGAISMNRLTLNATCKCGCPISGEVALGEIEPVRLKRDTKRQYKARIYKQDYTFNKLTVKDELEVEERAVDLLDEDYKYEFDDGTVAKTLGWTLSEEDIQRVRNLDLSVYYAALLYQMTDAHGISVIKTMECPVCHKETKTILPITGDILNVDIPQLMARYVSVRPYLTMDNYFNVTLPEYNTFIRALNAKLAKK